MWCANRPSAESAWLAAPASTPMVAGVWPLKAFRACAGAQRHREGFFLTGRRKRLVGLGPAQTKQVLDPLFVLGARSGGSYVCFLDSADNFVALDLHAAGGINSNSDAVTPRIEHGNDNVITYQDLLS